MIRIALIAVLASGCFSEPERPACPAMRKLATVNSPGDDATPWLSEDRKELLFSSDRQGSQGAFDLYRATRRDFDVEFDPPMPLGAGLNTVEDESDPFLMPDGLTLWFVRESTIYTAQRADRSANEFTDVAEVTELAGSTHPRLTGDGLTIYFNQYDGSSFQTFTATRTSPTERFGSIREVTEIQLATFNADPAISRDGKTLLFTVAGLGGNSRGRIYRAHRGRDGRFEPPAPVDELDNPDGMHNDADAYLMPNDRTIVFVSERAGGNFELFVACE